MFLRKIWCKTDGQRINTRKVPNFPFQVRNPKKNATDSLLISLFWSRLKPTTSSTSTTSSHR